MRERERDIRESHGANQLKIIDINYGNVIMMVDLTTLLSLFSRSLNVHLLSPFSRARSVGGLKLTAQRVSSRFFIIILSFNDAHTTHKKGTRR
jgi:hypothetical protein